jgi:transcriptional regulator GlxA family with amidase domain
MLEMGYAILDAGQGASTTCSSESFKNADPAPNVPKQCFCDDRKTFTAAGDISAIMDYWVEQSMMTTQE